MKMVKNVSLAGTMEVVSIRNQRLEELLAENRTSAVRSLGEEILQQGVSNQAEVYRVIGEAYLREKNYQKAIRPLKKSVRAEPSAEAYYSLAVAQHHAYSVGSRPISIPWFPRPVRIPAAVLYLTTIAPFVLGHNVYVEWRNSILQRKAEQSLESAIQLQPKKEYFEYLLTEIVAEHPRRIIKHGEKAIQHHPQEALFYALVSNAYAQRGARNDSQALLQKAIALKYDDAAFIQEHFQQRLGEKDREGVPLFWQLLKVHDGINWRNSPLVDLVTNYLRENQNNISPLFFQKFLQVKLSLNPEDHDTRYEVAVGKALEARIDEQGKPENAAALAEALHLFSELQQQGYDIKHSPVGNLPYRLFKHYGKEIEEMAIAGGKSRLKLVN